MTDPPGPEFTDGARNAPVASVVYVATLDPVRLRRHSFWYGFIGVLALSLGIGTFKIQGNRWFATVGESLAILAGLLMILQCNRLYKQAKSIDEGGET